MPDKVWDVLKVVGSWIIPIVVAFLALTMTTASKKVDDAYANALAAYSRVGLMERDIQYIKETITEMKVSLVRLETKGGTQ